VFATNGARHSTQIVRATARGIAPRSAEDGALIQAPAVLASALPISSITRT